MSCCCAVLALPAQTASACSSEAGQPSHRLAAPFCAALVKSNLKQRPGTVSKCSDVCLALVELEQAETVVVRSQQTLRA